MHTPARQKEIEARAPGEKPPIKELITLLQDDGADTKDYYERVQESHDARYCLWDGQSDDGRKHEDAIGKSAFPWEGASDTRLRRAESIILESKNTKLAAFYRGSFQATGTDNDTDPAAAAKIAPLLRYLFRTKMRAEIRNELNFLINWEDTYGAAILWVDWHRELRMEEKPISIDDLIELAFNAAVARAVEEQGLNEQEALEIGIQSVEDLMEQIEDPEFEPVLVEQLIATNPHLDKKTARVVLEELREFGESSFPNPYVYKNCPRWTALRPGFDIFFPYSTSNIQEARFVARAEILTRAELEAKEIEEGWDPKFIANMLKKGEGVIYQHGVTQDIQSATDIGILDSANHTYADRVEEYKNQFQIFHFYYRGKDKKGFPVMFRTVTSPVCSNEDAGAYALDEINQYDHGMVPAIEFRRERFHRPILEDRGIAEIAWTAQNELKTHRDALIDQASITSNPPLIMPRQRSGVQIVFGPGRQIPEHRAQSMRWMDPPKNDGRTELASELIEDDLAGYFGLIRESVPPDKVMLYKQVLVDDFLTNMSEALKMTVAIYKQFGDPMTISRITNAAPIEISPEEIRGQYDIVFEFDVRDLMLEHVKVRAEVFEAAATLDSEGVLDRGAMAAELLSGYSPTLAERIVKDPQQAATDEIKKAKTDLAMMAQGIEPVMEEGGNYQLRAQAIMEALQANPELAQQFQQSEIKGKILETHLQFLQFQTQQIENAQIGKIGAQPALAG